MRRRNLALLVALFSVWSMANVRVSAAMRPQDKFVLLASPHWFAKFDGGGFCDWYHWGGAGLSECHPYDYHEMLSGEWAAAIYYDGIATDPHAMWLTDYFRFPFWTTNSDFELELATGWHDPTNPVPVSQGKVSDLGDFIDMNDTGRSIISNGEVRITIDYEVVDLGNDNSPLGLRTFANGWGYARSDRYVLLQTYTITNITASSISGIEFYQMLHGHPADEDAAAVFSVYESIEYVDPLEEYTPYNGAHSVGTFRYAITQWNDPDHDDATADHADWIGFGSTVEPDVVENGYYEGGHNYDENNRPDSGTHDSVEDRLLNGHPYSFGEVAGAMGWHLGTLAPQASVSLTLALMFGADFQEMKAPCQPPVAVAHWDFDEGAGAVAKDSVGSNDGTLVGGPEWVDGWTGVAGDYALEFDGDDYVALSYPVSVLAGDSVTVSAWVKPVSGLSAQWRPIVSQAKEVSGSFVKVGYRLALSGYDPMFQLNDICWAMGSTGIDTDWNHLMGTYDGSDIQLFVNGSLAAATSGSGYAGIWTDAFIGYGGPELNEEGHFEGCIDDVWVYGCPLTPDDDCFPTCHPDYGEWAHVGEPECWCFERQCHGDVDDTMEGTEKAGLYYVHFRDLNTLLAGWNVKEPPLGPGIASVEYSDDLGTVAGICADFAHDVEGTEKAGLFRVHFNDLNILIANWNTKEQPLGPGIATDCLDCGGGDSMMMGGGGSEQVDFERMMVFLEGLWLDEDALKGLDQDALLKVMESLAEAVEGL